MYYGGGNKTKTCKFGCGYEITWDDAGSFYKNVANGERYKCPNYPGRDGGAGSHQIQQQTVPTTNTATPRSSDISSYEGSDANPSAGLNSLFLEAIFLTNKISATLIIPIQMARHYGLNQPSHVVVEETENGILIYKLEV